MFDVIRKLISKRRKPPQRAYVPTHDDINMILMVKANQHFGITTVILPPVPKHPFTEEDRQIAHEMFRNDSHGLSLFYCTFNDSACGNNPLERITEQD